VPSEREIVEVVLAKYNEEGPSAPVEWLQAHDALDPDFGAVVQSDTPNGGEWHGAAGYNEMTRTWLEVWEEFKIIPHSYEELSSGRWLVPATQWARSHAGAEVEGEFFYSFKFTEGRMSEFGIWAERAQAEERLKA
jgi:hypothetical protein